MVRSIIISLLFSLSLFAQTNRIIYEQMLDSLLTVSPNIDSIETNIDTLGQSIHVNGRVTVNNVWHVYGGFQDSSITIDVLDEDWTEITNASNTLWGGTEADGFTISGDTMTVVNGGDYTGSVSITFAALTNKDYHFRIYNVTQTAQVGFYTGASTTGATNFTNINLPIYLEATAGDELVLQVYGVSDGTNIIVEHGTFFITYLHD